MVLPPSQNKAISISQTISNFTNFIEKITSITSSKNIIKINVMMYLVIPILCHKYCFSKVIMFYLG